MNFGDILADLMKGFQIAGKQASRNVRNFVVKSALNSYQTEYKMHSNLMEATIVSAINQQIYLLGGTVNKNSPFWTLWHSLYGRKKIQASSSGIAA